MERGNVVGTVVGAVVALAGGFALIAAVVVTAGDGPGVIVGIHVYVGSVVLFQAVRAEWTPAGVCAGAFEQGLAAGTGRQVGVHGGRRPCCLESAFEVVVRRAENGVVGEIV